MSIDENGELIEHRPGGEAWKQLESGLTDALAQMQESQRGGITLALEALLQFIDQVPGWERRGFGLPIWQLLAAFQDLDNGRVVRMLLPNPNVHHRKPDPTLRKIVRAYALICLDVLCRSGWSLEDGSRLVAREPDGKMFPFGKSTAAPHWKIVMGWRSGFSKLKDDDQTKVIFDGLKRELASKSFSRQEAGILAKGQLRELLTNLGKPVLE